MRNRRLSQISTSDDEDGGEPPRVNSDGDVNKVLRKRKKLKLLDEDEDEMATEAEVLRKGNLEKIKNEAPDPQAGSENDEQGDTDPQPLGEVVRVSGEGERKRNHFSSFEFDGLQYQLEDPVLLVPETSTQHPHVAIIKDIYQTQDGAVMVTGQWFYRQKEAEKRGGGNWPSCTTGQLFYSFDRQEVPAKSVLHKCVVHFIPEKKQIPHRKQHPGFIVQKVYDTEQMRLFKFTDKYYGDNKQREINLLVEKTRARIGDLPDLVPEEGKTVEEIASIRSRRSGGTTGPLATTEFKDMQRNTPRPRSGAEKVLKKTTEASGRTGQREPGRKQPTHKV